MSNSEIKTPVKMSFKKAREKLNKINEEERQEWLKQFKVSNDLGFWNFAKYLDPEFFKDEKFVLKEIAIALQKVLRGKIEKLIINIRSRTGKSYLTTMWCLYALGNKPTGSIMRNAYGDKLARKFSRDVRKIIGLPGSNLEVTDKLRKVFPEMKLSSNQKGVYGWALETAKDVSYSCAGMKGAAKGHGCDIALILDDPSKDEEDNVSEAMHEKIWDTYLRTHRNRKSNKNVAEIVIMTRSHKDDITGKLEQYEGLVEKGGKWYKICYPALDENDESFCEAIHSTNFLLEERQLYKSSNKIHIWETQDQQNPTPAEGLLFPSEDLNRFRIGELRTDEDYRAIVVDFADEGTDYLASIGFKVFGLEVYITNVVFTTDPPKKSKSKVVKQFLEFEPHKARFESNTGGKLYAGIIEDEIRDLLSTSIETDYTTSHKLTRILSRSGIILDRFYFLHSEDIKPNSPYDRFITNLTTYQKDGSSSHDDAPDVCAGTVDLVGVKSKETKVYSY